MISEYWLWTRPLAVTINMDGPFSGCRLGEAAGFIKQCGPVSRCYGVWCLGVFHLTDIQNVVGPVYQHVYLCSRLSVRRGSVPGIDSRQYA